MRFIVYFFALSLLFFWACESAESGPGAAGAESVLLEQLPGTWESVSLKVFVNTVDSLIYEARGIWSAEVDTLRMVEEDGTSYRYRVKVRNGLSEFRAFVDWDADGVEDDEYIEIKRLVSIETQ